MPESIKSIIQERVHHYYWDLDLNCARTTLLCLGEVFDFPIAEPVMQAAIGLHGAGGYRAQCGLVEGALMFIGLFFSKNGKPADKIVQLCYRFAELYESRFFSLRCYDLRPGGFSTDDPPHRCEQLTVDSIDFAYRFIQSEMN